MGEHFSLSSATDARAQIAQAAAALMCDEGLHHSAACERAARALGLTAAELRRVGAPDAAQLEAAVLEHIALFCPQQREQLRALREIALQWLERLAAFTPLLGGAVWHGTATRAHDVFIAAFSDDAKALEIALIDAGADFEPTQQIGMRGRVREALSVLHPCRAAAHRALLGDAVGVHITPYDSAEMRGALLPDKLGRKPRGTLAELQTLLQQQTSA